MANAALENLSAAGSVAGTDLVPIKQAGATLLKGTVNQLATGILSGDAVASGGTANGVLYLNGSKVASSGSALTFDGSFLVTPSIIARSSASAGYTSAVFGNNAANGYTQLLFDVGINGANGQASISYAPGVFFAIGPVSNDTTTPIVFRLNNAVEQMRLTSTGLGIGTSSPGAKLDVNGGAANTEIRLNHTDNSPGRTLTLRMSSTVAGGAYAGAGAYVQAIQGTGVDSYSLAFGTTLSSTSATERMRLDASGNLGLGVTPSAWQSSIKAMQFTGGAVAGLTATDFRLYANAYDNSGSKYVTTNAAGMYRMASGEHIWYTAPSGTAGDPISFSQAMTLDASGRLGIGTSSPDIFGRGETRTVGVSSAGATSIGVNAATGSSASIYVGVNGVRSGQMVGDATSLTVLAGSSKSLVLGANFASNVVIDSSGNFTTTVTGAAPTLSTNGTMSFELTSNTSLKIVVRGSDGTTRSASLTLA